MFNVPEIYRKAYPLIPLIPNDKTWGYFLIPHNRIKNYCFGCLINVTKDWEQVVVTVKGKDKRPSRCPTWDEMCFIKSMFWEDEDPVMQLHPPKSDWINNHPYSLHLWRPVNKEIPLPPSNMVGIKE